MRHGEPQEAGEKKRHRRASQAPLRLQRFQGPHTMYTIIDPKGRRVSHWTLIQPPVLSPWHRWAPSLISSRMPCRPTGKGLYGQGCVSSSR